MNGSILWKKKEVQRKKGGKVEIRVRRRNKEENKIIE